MQGAALHTATSFPPSLPPDSRECHHNTISSDATLLLIWWSHTQRQAADSAAAGESGLSSVCRIFSKFTVWTSRPLILDLCPLHESGYWFLPAGTVALGQSCYWDCWVSGPFCRVIICCHVWAADQRFGGGGGGGSLSAHVKDVVWVDLLHCWHEQPASHSAALVWFCLAGLQCCICAAVWKDFVLSPVFQKSAFCFCIWLCLLCLIFILLLGDCVEVLFLSMHQCSGSY